MLFRAAAGRGPAGTDASARPATGAGEAGARRGTGAFSADGGAGTGAACRAAGRAPSVRVPATVPGRPLPTFGRDAARRTGAALGAADSTAARSDAGATAITGRVETRRRGLGRVEAGTAEARRGGGAAGPKNTRK
jgi:hypothetical protein